MTVGKTDAKDNETAVGALVPIMSAFTKLCNKVIINLAILAINKIIMSRANVLCVEKSTKRQVPMAAAPTINISMK